jgi:hypothetical protein
LTLLAISVAWAVILSAALAWDFGRRWLLERSKSRMSDELLLQFSTRLDQHELVQKQLAEDWLKKFRQLEADWKKLKEHADSQVAGTLAQVMAQQPRGFNR